MGKIKIYFQKAGGNDFIKKLLRNRLLFYAAVMFLILPKNRFGMEVLEQCIEHKILRRLKQKHFDIISKSAYELRKVRKRKIIWFCWLQGIDNAPQLVKNNLEKIRFFYVDYEIVIITKDNFSHFSDIPDYIVTKWRNGIITHTHFSDILRTCLLVKNGGLWIDSTVVATAKIPVDIEEAKFFLFRSQKPGSKAKAINVSSWFMTCVEQHPIMHLVQDLLFEYWKNHNYLCDYFLFHLFLEISIEKYGDCIADMPIYSNEPSHILQYAIREGIGNDRVEELKKQCFVHKLTNKFSVNLSL